MFANTYREEIAEIIRRCQTWSIIEMTAKAIETEEHQGADDGYNQAVWIDEGQAVCLSHGGSHQRGYIENDTIFTRKGGLCKVEGFVINGGCGYGSVVRGFISAYQLQLRFQSCSGHWIRIIINLRDGGVYKYGVNITCDGLPSEQSWGDHMKGIEAQLSRARSVKDWIEPAVLRSK